MLTLEKPAPHKVYYFDGDIDEFRIYRRPLASQQALANYNAIMNVSRVHPVSQPKDPSAALAQPGR